MTTVQIRQATPNDDALIGLFFRRMWIDIGIPSSGIVSDATARVQAFIDHAREHLDFRAFVAESRGEPVGCVAAQKFAGLYPDILAPGIRNYAYLWGVYVALSHRRQGLGRTLTQLCLESLRGNYTHVYLHASPMGRAIYQRLGFVGTREMKLEL